MKLFTVIVILLLSLAVPAQAPHGDQQRVFEIAFVGDPNIDERMRAEAAKDGGAFSIRELGRDQRSVWLGAQEIVMQKSAPDNFHFLKPLCMMSPR